MSDTDMLYISSLQKRIDKAEAENAKLKQKLRDCMRILAVAEFDFPKFTEEADRIYEEIEKLLK